MITAVQLVERVHGLSMEQLEVWVAADWVRPEHHQGAWYFTELDVARASLIREIRDDLAVDEETVPVILSLLDQLYAARHETRALAEAINQQPESVRDSVRACLQRLYEEE